MKKILVALTDKDNAIKINNVLEDLGHAPYIVTDSTTLITKIRSGFHILILDIDIIEELELNVAKFIKERNARLQVVIVSQKEKIDTAISLASKYNFMYINKPINMNELKYTIDKIKPIEEESDIPDDYFENKFVGKSEKIKKVMSIVRKVAPNDSNILITGETGTGKELIARAVYEMSNRSDAPFIAVNSAAIPENLMESELFGYKKGAFTGANSDKKGLIELADKGTLFLDEIGDLDIGLQAKILRIIEYKELRRLGDENSKRIDLRIIAATNMDLRKAIEDKRFREDLFFRLNVIHIHIPALRERKEDIPLLIRFFIEKYNKINNRNIVGIDAKAKAVLMYYDYPGNVREMENIVQHAFALAESDIVTVDDLPVHMQNITPYQRLEAHNHPKALPGKGGEIMDDSDLLLSEVERRTILLAFDRYGVNHTKVAKVLGVSRSTLWRKMKEYDINFD